MQIDRDCEITDFDFDSQKIREGMLFFAIKGEKTDGHLYLKEVKAKGAVAAIVDRGYSNEDHGLLLLKVESVPQALKKLARTVVAKKQREVIAVTGSIGKTTVKEFIAGLLKQKYPLFKTPASYNSQLGFPLSILKMLKDEELLVLEMGMSKRGEIKSLLEIAAPDIAVITKITCSHAANFHDGIDGIADAKAEILSSGRTRLALVHREVEKFSGIFDSYPVKRLTYSLDEEKSDFFLKEEREELSFYESGKFLFSFPKPFPEKHFWENCLVAIAVGRIKKIPDGEIIKGILSLRTPKMRFEKFERDGVVLINDAYNSTPDSSIAALKSLRCYKGRKIAVLGSMKELGKYSKMAHEAVALCALKEVDELFCFGEETMAMVEIFMKEGKKASFFLDFQRLCEELKVLIKKGDVVLIKGSRSLAMERIFELLKLAEFRL